MGGIAIGRGISVNLASNIGLNSGIVMATGDIAILDPNFAGFGDFVDVVPASDAHTLIEKAS